MSLIINTNEPLADSVDLERCRFFLPSASWVETKRDETAAKQGTVYFRG